MSDVAHGAGAERVNMTTDTGLYTEQFNLSERPFTLLPDPEFIYWTPMHRRAYSILEYGILTHADRKSVV